jgi:hypothetical protein
MLKSTFGAGLALALLASTSAHAACGTLPNPLTEGATAHAYDVTADLNCILVSPSFTGPVGIGTTSPGNLLELKNSGASSPGIRINNTTTFWQLGVGVNSANDSNFGIYSPTAGNAFVINGSGQIGIGTTSPTSTLEVDNPSSAIVESRGLAGYGSFYALSSGANNSYHFFGSSSAETGRITVDSSGDMFFQNSSSAYERMAIDYAGNVWIGTPYGGSLYTNGTDYAGNFVIWSDETLKSNIASVPTGALNVIAKLRPVNFQWTSPGDDGMKGQQTGFLAQEVAAVLPSVVLTKQIRSTSVTKDPSVSGQALPKDPAPQNAGQNIQGIKYNELVALLTKAVQEQQAEIAALQQQIAALQAAH